MNQSEGGKDTCRNPADFTEPNANVKGEEHAAQNHGKQAFNKEPFPNGGFYTVGGNQGNGIVGFGRKGNACLGKLGFQGFCNGGNVGFGKFQAANTGSNGKGFGIFIKAKSNVGFRSVSGYGFHQSIFHSGGNLCGIHFFGIYGKHQFGTVFGYHFIINGIGQFAYGVGRGQIKPRCILFGAGQSGGVIIHHFVGNHFHRVNGYHTCFFIIFHTGFATKNFRTLGFQGFYVGLAAYRIGKNGGGDFG